jgi:hypothetical protein
LRALATGCERFEAAILRAVVLVKGASSGATGRLQRLTA